MMQETTCNKLNGFQELPMCEKSYVSSFFNKKCSCIDEKRQAVGRLYRKDMTDYEINASGGSPHR